jgi:hypothetical protein
MTTLAVTSVNSNFCHDSTCLRIGSKFRCIRSTPTEMQSMSENDFECFANTGVNTPVTMSLNSGCPEVQTSSNRTSWELRLLLTITLHWPTYHYLFACFDLDYFGWADYSFTTASFTSPKVGSASFCGWNSTPQLFQESVYHCYQAAPCALRRITPP